MDLGLVSARVEEEVRGFVRRHGVVVWLDRDRTWMPLVERLIRMRESGELPYPVYTFRGSYLELMIALDGASAGSEVGPMLLHLPGFNEETAADGPLCEIYELGRRFRRALDTAVSEAAAGRVPADEVAAFLAGKPNLEQADVWLGAQVAAAAGGPAAWLQATRLPALLDDLLASPGPLQGRLEVPVWREAVWVHLAACTGLPASWRAQAAPGGRPSASDVAFAVASWALAVEYVDDLKRAPVDPHLAGIAALSRPLVDTCRELAVHLRERHGTFYRRTADETEGWLTVEVAAARAEDLGKIDTFRFEEERVLEAALRALADEQWSFPRTHAETRHQGRSYWVREDPQRQATWALVHDAAALGQALEQAGPGLSAATLDEALARYVSAGSQVDRAHRHLEQRRVAQLDPALPSFASLRDRLDALRALWRVWADNWARDFNQLCRREGFLPPRPLQQRTLFEEVVRPLTRESGITALFVVDALRFEMADELYAHLSDLPATVSHLGARFAELPTITAVGMDVLAPVSREGRLSPAVVDGAFRGFSTGEFRVVDPATRGRAMWDRVGGGTCPWLSLKEVLGRDTTSLKQAVSRARLVVVHSDEIDRAGENDLGARVFDAVLRDLRAAWRLLREAGVRRFVITADHGFLLLDDTALATQVHGRKVDPKRRHVISPVAADHPNEARVALSDLGYEGTEGLHLMMPASTGVFDVGRRMSFVHGGNSLQERVIPVLTVIHRAAVGGDTARYRLQVQTRDGVAGLHCLSVRVENDDQGQLAFGGAREVELAMRVADLPSADWVVELCQVRGPARIVGAAFSASVGHDVELFFKVVGPGEARVAVEIYPPTGAADLAPFRVEDRYDVSAPPRSLREPPAAPLPASPDRSWLDALEPGIRELFGHLAAHGTVTEDEAQAMLGGPRALRRFAANFEHHVAKAPFAVRIDHVGGVKRYVKEG